MADLPEIEQTPGPPRRSEKLGAEAVDGLMTRGQPGKPGKTAAVDDLFGTNDLKDKMHLPKIEIVNAADQAAAARITDRQSHLSALTPQITKMREQAEHNASLRADGKPTNNTYDFNPNDRTADKPGDQTNKKPETRNRFDESNFQDAVQAAKDQHKPLVMVLGFPGCPHCQTMDNQTLLDPKVMQQLNDKAVFVHVDITKAPQIAQQYGTHSYPTTIITRPGERELYRSSGDPGGRQFNRTLHRYLKD